MTMNSQNIKCKVCGLIDFEYNEELCRNICLRCNAMQEMTNIGVSSIGYESGINFKGLQVCRAPIKRKMNSKTWLKNHIKKMKRFKLEDMFHWIYDLQLEAMRRFVTNFEKFKTMADQLWKIYMQYSGTTFDLKKAKTDDLRLKKYPLGWGTSLDPNNVEATLNIVPKDFYKLQRDENSDNSDIEKTKKYKKNATKVKIEKMVKSKLEEDSFDDIDDNEKDIKSEEKTVKTEAKIKKELQFMSSDSDESPLEDEGDESYIKFYNLKGKEQSIVRVMRRKRECHIRYFGGRVRTRQLFMENNLLLLYYALRFTPVATEHCCCLMDIWRLARRGDIPFLKIARFLPADKFFLRHTVFQSMILRDNMPHFDDLKHYAIYLAETLNFEVLIKPKTDGLIARLIKEHNLPSRLIDLVYYIRGRVEPKIDKYYKLNKTTSSVVYINSKWGRFKKHHQHILFPELISMAYIFMAMRMMMRLDGQFEHSVSRLASEVQSSGLCDEPLFLWTDWLQGQRPAPTISTARTWRDFNRVTSARAFFEEESTAGQTKYEDGLLRNDLVNICGRFVQPYKPGTEDAAIMNLLRSLENVQAPLRPSPPRSMRDFTGASIEYLGAPDRFMAGVETRRALDPDPEERGVGALNRLVALVRARPLAWREWSSDNRRYPRGVFEEQMEDNRMTESEYGLLEVLTYNSGVSCPLLHATVDRVARVMLMD